ncbi:hypothetical protein WR25_27268 [Diploscapter pachys]|uniref:C2H2-type domain-containing protein n=1 Tax=Diploscapter pachys TaxID=2018661 RepID=A0A2A2KJC3_9BILA|nr:hypothetical protein WR25_27268 [Diploscapter pachys]
MSIPRINVPIGYKCPECPAVKYSEDEMEAHLTWEHLKYQPFECIQCGERRPTEHLIEEHMWASHQKFNEKVYYIPNKQARQRLRELMKQAFTNAYASVSSPEASAPSINPPKTLPTQTLPTQLLTPFQLNAAAFRFPLQNLTQIFTPQAQASFLFSRYWTNGK